MSLRILSVTVSIVLGTTFVIDGNAHAESTLQLRKPTVAEGAIVEGIQQAILGGIQARFNQTKKATRDAHAKHHGCVLANFTVLPGLEQKDLNYGVFSIPGKTYPAVIRYSNGSGDPNEDDRKPGGRGMAVKVMGVTGTRILASDMDDEQFTQDFQMINYPAFFAKDLPDYIKFMTDPQSFFGTHPEEAAVIQALNDPQLDPPADPLSYTYYSMTPRQLGTVVNGSAQEIRPVKFSARPIPCNDGAALGTIPLDLQSPNALSIALKQHLDTQAACYEFRIQRQTNDTDMPVENPVKIWNETQSPFVPVARIEIFAKQDFAKRDTQCEDLSITPWHSLIEHQPLGGIELARKAVYQATSELRHRLNQRPRREPKGFGDFN